jgi:hypothetical protein
MVNTVTNNTTSQWPQFTTERPWRHTIGRISCLARVPLYTLAALAQTSKLILKSVVVLLTAGQLHRLIGSAGYKLTFGALARDGVMLGSLLERTGSSFKSAIVAPPENYRSFAKALKQSGKIVFLDDYHYSKGAYVNEVNFDLFRKNVSDAKARQPAG